ncbi:hypothetical protein BDN70DRAFT_924123 [Pholiota conissans]|uniref:Uncharacterized protein n=1 Tax=Pholiota conissans TaxID=109636 RepID=A0A9P5YV25_9AGAR|nr:hypothetical protein BDN70DRAFT_924123 [Pholiota conissans]
MMSSARAKGDGTKRRRGSATSERDARHEARDGSRESRLTDGGDARLEANREPLYSSTALANSRRDDHRSSPPNEMVDFDVLKAHSDDRRNSSTSLSSPAALRNDLSLAWQNSSLNVGCPRGRMMRTTPRYPRISRFSRNAPISRDVDNTADKSRTHTDGSDNAPRHY